MAEEKKDAGKKDAPKDETHWAITFFPLVFVAIILIIGSRMSGVTIFGDPVENFETDPISSKKNVFSVYEWLGPGEMFEGERVINIKDTPVRNAPAGGIVGTQKKLTTGILKADPEQSFGTIWWRVDYPEAPDGWVNIEQITTHVNTVRGMNIVPILYGLYKPIGYTLLFVLLLTLVYFKLQLSKEEKIFEKKKRLKDEQYQEKPVPISVRIEQKPDVEELPGFQTEEIIPVEILEHQSRWKHIQELVKSYNANDWRQAIIEADIILEEMLDKMQYEGTTIGDKLKKVEKSDFVTLDRAWSAHRVRNQIAHDGSSFKLHRELAEKTIKDYEEVFREFYYI